MYPNVITEAFTIILISIVVALILAGMYGLGVGIHIGWEAALNQVRIELEKSKKDSP